MASRRATDRAARRASTFLAVAMLTALVTGPMPAATRTPRTKPAPNAALVYWQAFAMLPDGDAKKQPDLSKWKTLELDAKTRQWLKSAGPALHLLHKAAAIDHCDWGIDWTEGPHTLLPHLGKVRQLARLAMLRARSRLADGKTDDALGDVVAVLRLSRHVTQNACIIEMLVGIAIESVAIDMLTAELGKLTPARKKALADQFDALPEGTTLARAMLVEKAGIVDWIIDQLRKGGRKQFTTTPDGQGDTLPESLKGKTDKELLALAEDLGARYVAVSRAAALPPDQAGPKLDELEKQVVKADNPFVSMLMPTVKKIYAKQIAMDRRRRDFRRQLSADR